MCMCVCVCVVCRNAGKENSKEHLGGSVLDKIPFLHGCEDDDEDDSDEEDDFQGMGTDCIDGSRKNKKPRVKVSLDLEFSQREREQERCFGQI